MRFLFYLCCLPLLCFSQDKIEGLGKFKAGKTTISIVDEVASELSCKIKPVSMAVLVDEHGLLKPSIVELIKDDKLPVDPPQNISPCPGSRTFYINKYKIADMDVVGLYLVFYDQKLTTLICQASSSLNEALEIKYGNAPAKTVYDTLKCHHPLTGAETILQQRRDIRQWQNESILAQNRVMLLYDKRCQAYQNSDLIIRENTLSQQMQDCEAKALVDSDANRKADRKEKLKDF